MGFGYLPLKVLTPDFWLCAGGFWWWCDAGAAEGCLFTCNLHLKLFHGPGEPAESVVLLASNCCGWSSGHSGNRPVGFSHGVLWLQKEGINKIHPFFFSVLAGSQLICHAILGRWCGEHGQKCFSQGRIYPELPLLCSAWIPCGAHNL